MNHPYVKLGEEIQKKEAEDFLYWSVYDKFGEEHREERNQHQAELKAERLKRFAALEEKEQKLLVVKNQIKLMNHLFTIGLSIDVIAKSLEVPVQQIQNWQKLKK